ncbi:hypothetical protein GCK32_011829 [Trichostrongylus colubriformis]|uniref:Uncharacterized protein n=1 Tax=Trichostrongylus colubriformis TaxID=6319 RepID=A0AAN8FVY8_TRICO
MAEISYCLIDFLQLQNRGVVLAVSLIALAIWDTVLLWCAFFYYAIRKLPIAINSDSLNILMPWFHPFSQIANTAATWCVVAITWQRFMATRDPFRTPRSTAMVHSFRSERRISFMYCSTYRRLLRMPIALSVGAVLLNIPAFFELYNYMCYKAEENRIAISVRPTALRLQNAYALYRLISRMIAVSIGPNLGILILTLLTVFMLRGSNRTRRQMFQLSDHFLDRNASSYTIPKSSNPQIFRLLLEDRLSILSSTWHQALALNDNNPGMRILYSILRRQPTLFTVFRAPNLVLYANDKVGQVEADMKSLLTNGNAKSFDPLTNIKYVEEAQRITTFMGELIQMMKDGKPEEVSDM